ncbi:hypothetical protein [Marinicella litoralis]|uniref:Beta/gamma crystallin n=1 Tax=Marinicella litoralis TaxID=644220 RepID=A0A4V3DI44_9GAMM|nr:hypothetical protein [Marinicella litoralis]TDR20711.1 hypothetical protein C8D91_1689 [Marinicella litoralis]
MPIRYMTTLKYLLLILMGFAWAKPTSAAESNQSTMSHPQSVSTLWSDKKDCMEAGALIIAIENYAGTFKVAACVKYGCRIAVPEFGKTSHQLNYRDDPRFKWQSDAEFEAVIYGKNTRFYACDIEQK